MVLKCSELVKPLYKRSGIRHNTLMVNGLDKENGNMERTGTCLACQGIVHEYPFGTAHVNIPDFGHEPGRAQDGRWIGIRWAHACDVGVLIAHADGLT
jgi:hypothetical protein